MAQVELHIFGPYKGRLQDTVRLLVHQSHAAQFFVKQVGAVLSLVIGQGNIGIMGEFKRAVSKAAFISKHFQFQIRKTLSALASRVCQSVKIPVQGAVKNNLTRLQEMGFADKA